MKPQEFMFLGQGKSVGNLGGMLRLGKHQGWMADEILGKFRLKTQVGACRNFHLSSLFVSSSTHADGTVAQFQPQNRQYKVCEGEIRKQDTSVDFLFRGMMGWLQLSETLLEDHSLRCIQEKRR